ncbi:hypothetical protein [Microbacterium sp. Se5.02b]|uniref:hypothetical protein n=1 Tax=Microbacterium sp. Se5.02b TaxID=2864103 RepID=UPI0016052681|nr:hypothetical protein [Microbacterium sp. Se5.02b]QNA91649.1 hypothetical protein G4G29_02840 [Microbacterium sp. Se63.02b]QYM64834.1 hypothetical protein K1X59_02825 [Microbacterium sp. Se5.02b]
MITLGEKDEPAQIPLVRTHVGIDRDRPLVEGHPVTFTAQIDGADSYQWETAPEPGGPYTPVTGQNSPTWRVDSVDRATLHDRFIRLTGTNAVGTVVTGHFYVRTTTYRALELTGQPLPVHAIEGTRPTFAFTSDGMPVAKQFAVERSTDDGRTWTTVPGTEYRRLQLGAKDSFTLPAATLGDHDTLLRGVATTQAGISVRTDAVAYTVVAATGRPQLSARPLAGFTPEGGGSIWVTGAGFEMPQDEEGHSYSLDVGLFAAGSWAPGEEGHREWIATSGETRYGQLYRESMRYTDNSFGVTIRVPAGVLTDDGEYGIGAFLRRTLDGGGPSTFHNRTADAWTSLREPIVVPLPTPGTTPDGGTDPGDGTHPGGGTTAVVSDAADGRGLATTGSEAPLAAAGVAALLLLIGGGLIGVRRRAR